MFSPAIYLGFFILVSSLSFLQSGSINIRQDFPKHCGGCPTELSTSDKDLLDALDNSRPEFKKKLQLKELPKIGKIGRATHQALGLVNFEIENVEIIADGQTRLCNTYLTKKWKEVNYTVNYINCNN